MINTKEILLESRKVMNSMHKVDLTSMVDFKNMLVDDYVFDTYKSTLTESVAPEYRPVFGKMIDQTRMKLLESINSVYQLTPYETLALPVLTAFFPRLVMKEMVTLRPIEAPDTIMPFMNFQLINPDGSVRGTVPYLNNASFGPSVPVTANKFVNPGVTNILAANGYTSDTTAIERTFKFYKFSATKGTTTETVEQEVTFTVDGNFFATLTFPTIGSVVVSGKIDYRYGDLSLAVHPADLDVFKAFYTCVFSLERNAMNVRIKPIIDKIRLIVEDQQISADWTVQLEQDFSALFDLDIQAQVIDVLGKQMALDLDKWILNDILAQALTLPASHKLSFSRTPPSGYTLGPIYWYQNILEKLTRLSAQIYTDTNIGEGNVIGCNPIDAAIFESLNKFSFDGKGADGGAMGYTSGSLAQRWKVFSSPIFPVGTMVILHKPSDVLGSIYVLAPYQPAVMTPYPLGNTPSLTILSRNAKKFYRPLGSAILEITS